MEHNTIQEKKKNIYALLGILYAGVQYLWTYFLSSYFKRIGTLPRITSPIGFIPAFFFNLVIAIPMIIVFIGTVIRYRREFDDKMMYIKTDRYLLTLILTMIYALMLPLSTRLDLNPRRGAFAWIYYLVFISFFEEFLYRGLVPTLMDRSSFPSWIRAVIPALVYGIYQSALPLAQYGLSLGTLTSILPDIIWSTIFHFALMGMKKWTGAMWLPIIVHAIIDLSIYFIF